MNPGDKVAAGQEVEEGIFRCSVCGKVLLVEEPTILPKCPVCLNEEWGVVGADD